MKKFFRIICGRVFAAGLFIFIQVLFVFLLVYQLSEYSLFLRTIMSIVSFGLIIYLVNKHENPMFTLSWSLAILLFPPAGWIFYFIFRRRDIKKISGKEDIRDRTGERIDNLSDDIYRIVSYIYSVSDYRCSFGSKTEYFPTGETFYSDYIYNLKKAEKYIFLEYFIYSRGQMWTEVYEILKERASKGVEIRIIYDDLCSSMFDRKMRRDLENRGIKTAAFNEVKPFPNIFLNYRDHRKITVIDGELAYTGGINVADEYINRKERFGYWKDSVVKITGLAAVDIAVSFLRMWQQCTSEKINLKKYKTERKYESNLVLPFDDNPGDSNRTAEMIYLKIINNSEKYVYITTPYLIPDVEMLTALRLAAKSGIDVRIVTPHIPDKKIIFSVTRSNYLKLLKDGVQIYEYLPGFIHSKTIVSDDESAVVGTANFDYRSFYLLYENGVYMYRTDAVIQMKTDFEDILKCCVKITEEYYHDIPVLNRFLGAILKIFSPLM